MNRFARRYDRATTTAEYASDRRSRTERDAARILYSPYYQRLADVTQILSPGSTHHVIHSRQAHAEKTAQMASTLAYRLLHSPQGVDNAIRVGGIDTDVALAGGRAHDLGHPPFGHIGEQEFDRLAREWGLEGFQGNAQSFRVVTKLATQPGVPAGLNLTRATRNAMMKYPWFADADNDLAPRYWSAYHSEAADLTDARSSVRPEQRAQPTAEATIVDFADDITFALHDFEDFWKIGLLSPALLAADGANSIHPETVDALETKYDVFNRRAWATAITDVSRFLSTDPMKPLREPWEERRDQEEAVRDFTSHFLTTWVDGLSFSVSGGGLALRVDDACWHQVNTLKQVTWDRVIDRPTLGVLQTGHRKIVSDTCTVLRRLLRTRPSSAPTKLVQFRDLATKCDPPSADDEYPSSRAVIDYVASLTERQLVALHKSLIGADALELQGWVQ